MTPPTAALTIGALAQRTGSSIQTIRYYERIGLLPRAPRSAGGHRLYDAGHEERLMLVRKGRALGLPIERVRHLVDLAQRAIPPCGEARGFAEAHVRDIDRQIATLRSLRRTLALYIADCSAKCGDHPTPHCGVVTGLLSGARAAGEAHGKQTRAPLKRAR